MTAPANITNPTRNHKGKGPESRRQSAHVPKRAKAVTNTMQTSSSIFQGRKSPLDAISAAETTTQAAMNHGNARTMALSLSSDRGFTLEVPPMTVAARSSLSLMDSMSTFFRTASLGMNV